ncbi:MAG: enoyl-CoA hydratase/isomerase family protein [Actinomycetota bacterium]
MGDWDLTRRGTVHILTMADDQNRIGQALLASWEEALDEVESAETPRALVTTGVDRFWSTGLDLDEVTGMSERERFSFMNRLDLLLGRILTAPFITVAALNGHTIAGGALLALAHDFRIMREDRGFMSLPSVDIGIPFTPGMSALIIAKVPQPAAHDLVVSCRQIGAQEAAKLGILHDLVPVDEVLPSAVDLATSLANKDPETLRTVKRRLYPEAASMLTP